MNGLGLDTARLVVPVGPERRDAPEPYFNRRGQLALGSGWYAWISGGRAFLEGSLPRRMFNSNVRPLPFALLVCAVRDVLAELGRHRDVQENIDLRSIRVKRLDVVRDFQAVASPGVLFQSLAEVPRPRRLKWQLWGRTQVESLTVGVERWSISLYDKFIQTSGAAAQGHVRCEARLRDGRLNQIWARDHGGCVNVVADVSEAKMEELARASFELVGFDATVNPVYEALRRALHLPDFDRGHQKATLLGTMIADAAGLSIDADHKTLARYRDAVRENELGVGHPSLLLPTRLDWQTGREVSDGSQSRETRLLEAS
jgi:hypothetical protein